MEIPRPRAFGTAQVATDKIAHWECHNAAQLIALDVRAPSTFDAVEVNLQLTDVHLARVRASAHLIERSADAIAANPADSIAVYIPLRGEAVVERAGHARRMRPGQLLLCDADRPLLRRFSHGLDELAIKIPRRALPELDGSTVVGKVLDADRHARALAQLTGRAIRQHDRIPADEQAVRDLVAVLAADGRPDLPMAHRTAARAYIDEQLSDPELSAAAVAAAVGISERTLSRVFAAAGTSVPRQILTRRLDAAYSLLSGSPLRIADVAARCGFNSSRYFSQTFGRRFGRRPSDVRDT